MATVTKVPAFGGLDRTKTLAENTVNAGPVVLDSSVTLKNPDGTGFKGGSLTGLKLVGQLGFFDSTLGDIRTGNTFVCQ